MEIEHLGEFDALRETAWAGLRSGSFADGAGWPLCRYVVLPSSQNPVAWDVRSPPARRKSAEAVVFRSCWRMDLDSQAFGSPVERLKHPRPYRPTVEVGSAPIDAAKIEGLIGRLWAIPVPLAIAEPPYGTDGTYYELEVGDVFCHARIGWWAQLPEEWEALGPVVAELVALFESSWNGG